MSRTYAFQRRLGLAIIVLLCSWRAFSFAQTPQTPEDESLSLGEMKIATVSKRAQKVTDAPAAVFVITDRMIQERGYNNLAELLEDIPEVEFNKRTAGEYGNFITMRGIAGSEKLVVLRDGFRFNSPTGAPFMLGPQYSLVNVKRVEVIIGPASALYGPDVFAGIVNIITKTGEELRGSSVSTSFGRYGTVENTFATGFKLSAQDGVSVAISGQRFTSNEPDFPNLYPSDYKWYNTKYKTQGKLLANPFSNAEVAVPITAFEIPTSGYALNLKINAKNFELGYARNRLEHSAGLGWRPEFTLFREDVLFGNMMEAMWAQYTLQSVSGKWESRTALSRSMNELPPEAKFLNTYSNYFDAYKYAYDKVVRLEEQVNFNLSDAVFLTAGGSYEDFESLPQTSDLPFQYDKTKAADAQNIHYIGTDLQDKNGASLLILQDFYHLDFQNLGGYAQLQVKAGRDLEMTFGGRYDHNTRYGDSFKPRVGLVYTPTTGVKMKLLYGEAILAPSPHKAYQHFGSFFPVVDSTNKIVRLGSAFWRLTSPDLKPERMRAYEGSFVYYTAGGFVFSCNAYYTALRDLIVDSGRPNVDFKGVNIDFVQTPTNRGEASNYGGTLRLETQFRAGKTRLKPYFSYSYSDGEIDGGQLYYTAKHTLKAGVDLTSGKLSLSPRLLYRGASYHPALNGKGEHYESAPYTVVNLYARFSNLIMANGWKASVFAQFQNLFDARYYNLGSASDLGTASFILTPQDPLRWNGGVAIDF